jgi:hypothetical protein
MSVPTFDQMRKCMAPIWQNEDYQRDILWAGVFGSVARNRAHEESDVDILIVLKEHERGEPIDLRESEFPFPVLLLLSLTLSRPCRGVWARNLPDVYLARTGLGLGPRPS